MLVLLGTPDEIIPWDGENPGFSIAKQLGQVGPTRRLQELVGVKRHDPIGAKPAGGQAHQSRHVLTLAVSYRGLTNEDQGQSVALKLLQHPPGTIRAAVVEYDMDIEGMGMMTDEWLDNVRFILHAADCD